MPSTNAPHNIATSAGTISVETEIIDSQHRARQIPLVDVRYLEMSKHQIYYSNMLYKKDMLLLLIF